MARLGSSIAEYLKQDAALTALVGNRVFYIRTPDGTPYPVVVIRDIVRNREYTHDGITSMAEWFQIDVYAENPDSCTAAADRIISRLGGFTGHIGDYRIGYAFIVNTIDEHSQEYPVYRTIVEVRVGYSER